MIADLRKYEFIVFGIEHYNHLGIIRSLGEEGIRPIAIIIKRGLAIASDSKYIKQLHLVDSIEEGFALLQNKYNHHDETHRAFLLTGADDTTSYLDRHYDELKDGFIFNQAGKNGRVSYFMNKGNINLLAKKHGFSVLDYKIMEKESSIDDLEYPVITKSIESIMGGKKDVYICNSAIELKEAFGKIKSDPVLVQKYIHKKNELCLDGFSVNRGRDVLITIGTDYKYILDNSYSYYMNVFNYNNSGVIDTIRSMLTEIGYEGIFTVEFLVDNNDKLHFLEINLRNSGWSYASTCLGMNMPVLWCESMLEGRIRENALTVIAPGTTAMADYNDFLLRPWKKKISFWKWYKEFKECDAVFLYNKSDKKPFFVAVKHLLANKCKKIACALRKKL